MQRALAVSAAVFLSLSAFADSSFDNQANSFPIFSWPTLAFLAALILGTAAGFGLWYRFFRLQPTDVASIGTRIELYQIPNTRLKLIGCDAMILPVGEDAWIGKNTGKIVRDVGGDVIQDQLAAAGQLGKCKARIVSAGKLLAKCVVACNIYDDSNRTSVDRAETGYSTAIDSAMSNSCDCLLFSDFTDDFDYSRDRTDKGFAAMVILDAIARHNNQFSRAKIFIPNPDNYAHYKEGLDRLAMGQAIAPAEPAVV